MLQKKNIFILLFLTALFYIFNIPTRVFECFFLLFALAFILVYRVKKNMYFHKVLLSWCGGTLLAFAMGKFIAIRQFPEFTMEKIKVNLNNLDKYFVKSELIPAIVYEADTKTVLMLAYMNEESLRKTLETGYTWFWSRSRQELWNKGATSGHLQKIVSIYSDCDDDTLLVNVKQTGVACHTGEYSCFFNNIYEGE